MLLWHITHIPVCCAPPLMVYVMDWIASLPELTDVVIITLLAESVDAL